MQIRSRRTDCCTISHPGLSISLNISTGMYIIFYLPSKPKCISAWMLSIWIFTSLQELCNTVHTRAQGYLGNWWNTGQARGPLRISINAKVQQQRGWEMPERSTGAKASEDHPRAHQRPQAAAHLGWSVWELCDPDSIPGVRGKNHSTWCFLCKHLE